MDLMKAFTDKYTKEEPPVVQVGRHRPGAPEG